MRLASQIAPRPVDRESGITEVRAWRLREPESKRAYTAVRVKSANGLVGYGECGLVESSRIQAAAALVKGIPVTAFEVAAKVLAAEPVISAGIDIAMLDIAGKMAKAPVYQVLGGPTRFKARAYTALPPGESWAASGYRAFSVPIPPPVSSNHGKAYINLVLAQLNALRTRLGESIDIVLDGQGLLTPGDAGAVAAAIEKFHVMWFDEPCRAANVNAIAKISSECVTPLGFGRNGASAAEFQNLLREQAIDVLRPDIGQWGISAIRRMAAIAETYYTAVAPHHDGGPIGTAAALHLAASLPNFVIQQIPYPAAEADRKMRAEIAGAAVERVTDGFAALPSGPGLGIQVDESALAKYEEKSA